MLVIRIVAPKVPLRLAPAAKAPLPVVGENLPLLTGSRVTSLPVAVKAVKAVAPAPAARAIYSGQQNAVAGVIQETSRAANSDIIVPALYKAGA